MKQRQVYCPTCDRYVELQKKSMPHVYHELWAFFIFLTFGIGYIIYFLIRKHQKRNTCPHCERTFDLSKPLPEGPKG
jgi:thiosulfate reductase cytochrome b subunit